MYTTLTYKTILAKNIEPESDCAPGFKYQFTGNRGNKEMYLITSWGCDQQNHLWGPLLQYGP